VNRARESRYLAGAAALAAAGVVAAGCGSSAPSSSAASASPTTGTQTLTGSVSGPAALNTAGSIPLTLSGVVNTTATLSLSANTQNPVMIKTGQGTLALTHTAGRTTQKLLSTQTCQFVFGNDNQYTVVGSKSTGTFKNATGNGTAVITLSGNLPKNPNGTCDTSTTAIPQASTARVSFVAHGPLTVKK
jgi:hypothetical protein